MDSSPPPDSTPPSPDPPSSSSSPPPPPSEDSTPPPSSPPPTPPSSSPPPASSSPPPSSPPPTTSSSPPPASSPPPTTPITSPSSPSPQNSDSSPPPSTPKTTSPPPPSNNDNKSPPSPSESSNYFSPPPPTHSSSSSSPPPPPSSKALSPPSPAQTHNAPPSNNEWTTDQMWAIGGIAVGAGLLLLVMLLLLCLCTRKKKKKSMPDHMQYYKDPSRTPKGGEHYTNGSKYTNYHNNHQPSDHIVKIPPPPGAAHGGWTSSPPPPPPPMMMSSIEEYSSSYTNSHTPPMQPPQQPSLGFNKSTFTYEELSAATGGFAQSNLLGQGGFGYVHKGVLPNGKEVAVKSLKSGSGQGEREFQAEVEIISRVHHRHLVSLVGYCIAGDQRMLVYEFLPNKTLEYHLHGKGRPAMDWSSRLKIAMGSAKGLAYLHEDCHPRIIHRDIKTANILLDFNMEAKVADFGLAKLSSDTYTHVSTRIMGTFGYLAPEYAASGKLTEKSDVFSYGVMILELITGKRPVDTTNAYMEDSLVDWARPIMARVLDDGNFVGLVDPHLENNYNAQEMTRMIACAAACIRHSARRRPKMSQIVRALEGDASLEDLNEVVKSSQSSNFSSSGSSEHQATSYNTNMKKFKRMELQSEAYESSEFGETSEYGLNPSSSSSDSSEELGSKTYGSRRQFT